MNNEVYAFALKSTLQEMQNACPDVSNSFVFKDGELLAKDEDTPETTVNQTITAFDAIAERAEVIGDLESITIQGANGRVHIASMKDFYLTTVSSKEADEKYVNSLTRVLFPTVIKLVEKIQPASADNETITLKEPAPVEDDLEKATEENFDIPEEISEEIADEAEDMEKDEPEEEIAPNEPNEEPEQAEPEIDDEPLLPEPPVTQRIVENLGGLLVPSDTVRIDNEVITQWHELYGDKKINEIEVEALNGKSTRCKFKHIKKSKDSGKGIIKIPEKLQLTLETSQGSLVTVKPVVE